MLALVAALALQAAVPTELPPLTPEQVIFDITPPDPPLRFYPPKARNVGREGKAAIDCLITQSGALDDCRLVAESPDRWGFGEAALNMRVLFNARALGKDGRSVIGRRVVVPIAFNLD